MVSLEMLHKQIISSWGPLEQPTVRADIPWLVLVPIMPVEALALNEVRIAVTAPEPPAISARWCDPDRRDG